MWAARRWICEAAGMRPTAVLLALNNAGCRYVVVGSAARALVGEDIEPNDLDVVIGSSVTDRSAVVAALSGIGGTVACRGRSAPLTARTPLPWQWSWSASTDFGQVDVIIRFIDDTTIDDHDRHAIDVPLGDGESVRCRPTRRSM